MNTWSLICCVLLAYLVQARTQPDDAQVRAEREKWQQQAKEAAERREFKNAIVSQLWELAKEAHKYDDSKLFAIKEDLWKLDGLNQRLEKSIKDTGRGDAMLEDQFREMYREFLHTYDISGAQDINSHDFAQAYQHKYRNRSKNSWITDEKLNVLWDRVQTLDFSAEEKLMLREEFEHYQEKLHELNELVATDPVFQLLSSVNFNDLLMSRAPLTDFPQLQAMGLNEDMARMKIMHYAELHFTVMNGGERLQLLQQANREFTQPAVAQLWREAQRQNFAVDELDTLKAELFLLEDKITEKEKFERELQKTLRMLDETAAWQFLEGARDNHLGLIGAIQQKIQELHIKLGLKVHGGEL